MKNLRTALTLLLLARCGIEAADPSTSPVVTRESAPAESGQDLAQQLANPVANLISVPFQSNYDFGLGPLNDGSRYTLNIQPVIPFSLSREWNLIVRTILPVISQHDVFYRGEPEFPGLPEAALKQVPPSLRDQAERAARKAFEREVKRNPQNRSQDGIGDVVQSFFFSPVKPVGGWIFGAGPVFLYPTASDDLLGTGRWGAGPTVVALQQKGPWTYGGLFNHIWSFAGDGDRNEVNSTFLNPFVSYITATKTTFTVSPELTYDWTSRQWLAPVNLVVSQLFTIGRQPLQVGLGGRYYCDGPSGGPEWGVRVAVTLLFPK